MPVSMVFISACLVLLAVSYLRLKFHHPDLPRKYTVPGGKVGAVLAVCPLFIAALINVTYNLTSTWRAVGVLSVVLLGLTLQCWVGLGTGIPAGATQRNSEPDTSVTYTERVE
eukprot:c14707_g1_i2.p1 GENE.c14707_g1_i2~~c14707_g1_i2.p1  ORF type:complete len:113 (+),score=19.33 c14707_g1_i2:371-709(+)